MTKQSSLGGVDLSKFNFKWQPWASLQAFSSAFFIFIGAVISIWYPSKIFMIIAFFTSTLVLLMEYPILTIPFLSTNYYARGAMLLVFAAAGMLQAPTHTGALCMLCAGLTYIRAAVNGENGEAKDEKGGKGGRR